MDRGILPNIVSRHMALLTTHGLVARESRGTSVYYRIADPSVYQLCDLVCGNLERQFERAASERALFVDSAQRVSVERPSARPARQSKRAA